MREQRFVSASEHLGAGIAVDRGSQAIGPVSLGDSSQFPQGVLETIAEALEAFGKADSAGLPVGVGEHEVIDHVVESFAKDGDTELGHAGEITLGEPPRLVNLREEHFFGRPFEGAPLFDPPLQATELDVGKSTREASLQIDEESLGLEPRIEPELIDELVPDLPKRILPGPPGVLDLTLTGEQVGVAVLACRLLVNAGLVSGLSKCVFGLDQLPQPPELAIGDHPYAPA